MKQKILEILIKQSDSYCSGQKISEDLGVSRNAVWKHIKTLKEEGFEIESIKNRGYKITKIPDHMMDQLSYGLVAPYLNTKFMGRKIYYYETIGSTNEFMKSIVEKNKGEGWVVIAEEQTEGKGRLGRTWSSPKNQGIWMSLLLRPDIPPHLAPCITQVVAAAIVSALNNLGIETKIKWPNDIVVNGKKVCGILTEMSGSLEQLNYIVVGIGMNINMDDNIFPEELKEKATSLKSATGVTWNRRHILGMIFNELEKYYNEFVLGNHKLYLDVCRRYSVLLGKEIQIIKRDSIKIGKALDIDENGALIVNINGNIEKVISGEVSVRGLYGYAK